MSGAATLATDSSTKARTIVDAPLGAARDVVCLRTEPELAAGDSQRTDRFVGMPIMSPVVRSLNSLDVGIAVMKLRRDGD